MKKVEKTDKSMMCFKKIKKANIFLVGIGNIGTCLLNQIKEQQKNLFKKHNLQLRVTGIADIDKFLITQEGIELKNWEKLFGKSGQKKDIDFFINKMINLKLENSVFVDCTASDEIAGKYETILKKGVSIATPNKKANSQSFDYYRRLKKLASRNGVKFFYETNVGAGLPVIGPLQNLILAGDEIYKIQGVFSGTLSYIFNNFSKQKKFSQIVFEAYKNGYTEPDPRDDLNGMDVARKLLILGREIGLKMELKDIRVESLLSNQCKRAKNLDEFFEQLKKSDAKFHQKITQAQKNQKTLRYIGELKNGKAKVYLKEVGGDHPCFNLKDSDNIIAFCSKYYKTNPMVVKGPGAGREVTAAGVFADIIKVIKEPLKNKAI
ncbi:MAG: hypothetical protein GF335_01785 [Candidatus Moranbacteria bacterium]|nr:hypothetical protein [Candidatus Moranbacteria bacterium]